MTSPRVTKRLPDRGQQAPDKAAQRHNATLEIRMRAPGHSRLQATAHGVARRECLGPTPPLPAAVALLRCGRRERQEPGSRAPAPAACSDGCSPRCVAWCSVKAACGRSRGRAAKSTPAKMAPSSPARSAGPRFVVPAGFQDPQPMRTRPRSAQRPTRPGNIKVNGRDDRTRPTITPPRSGCGDNTSPRSAISDREPCGADRGSRGSVRVAARRARERLHRPPSDAVALLLLAHRPFCALLQPTMRLTGSRRSDRTLSSSAS